MPFDVNWSQSLANRGAPARLNGTQKEFGNSVISIFCMFQRIFEGLKSVITTRTWTDKTVSMKFRMLPSGALKAENRVTPILFSDRTCKLDPQVYM
jgi:hypothetical protein